MRRALAVALLLLWTIQLSIAAGITNGTYYVAFFISDMGNGYDITILNYSNYPDAKFASFDILACPHRPNRSDPYGTERTQRVTGVVLDDRFHFIIPAGWIGGYWAYYFEGNNESSNGVFQGNGDVPYTGPNWGNNKFHFILGTGTLAQATERHRSSNQAVEAIGDPGSPQPHR
jgi:hypothetical protein